MAKYKEGRQNKNNRTGLPQIIIIIIDKWRTERVRKVMELTCSTTRYLENSHRVQRCEEDADREIEKFYTKMGTKLIRKLGPSLK